jgi:hypothetical protein
MAKKTMTVEEHYTRGRSHPYGRVCDQGSEVRIERSPSLEPKGGALRDNHNQDPEDRHSEKYDNLVPANSWLRSDGTKKAGFDKSNPWRKGR